MESNSEVGSFRQRSNTMQQLTDSVYDKQTSREKSLSSHRSDSVHSQQDIKDSEHLFDSSNKADNVKVVIRVRPLN